MLHFDLSQGCSINALCEALVQLGVSTPKSTDLTPVPKALFEKSRQFLQEAGDEPDSEDLDKVRDFCNLLALLDPKSVTATRIPVSQNPSAPVSQAFLNLCLGLPTIDLEWPAPSTDILSLACLKACVGRFGARGESTLKKIGFAKSLPLRALWSENPESTRSGPLVNIQCLLANSSVLSELTHRLRQIGAKKLWTLQVHDQNQNPATCLTVIASEKDKPTLIETLLVLGQASEVQIHTVEQHALQKRIVSVTLGKQQKLKVCRVTELMFGDQILRAEPLLEDLQGIAHSTGQAQEIIRADVLAAWKKRDKTA